MKPTFLYLAGFVVLFGMIAAPVQSRILAIVSSQSQAQPEAKTFTGTVLKSGEDFVLNDSAAKTRYILDNRDKARPYEGKRVKVTGTVDVTSNLIHVEAIQEIV